MPLVRCPECGFSQTVRRELAGLVVVCEQCGKDIRAAEHRPGSPRWSPTGGFSSGVLVRTVLLLGGLIVLTATAFVGVIWAVAPQRPPADQAAAAPDDVPTGRPEARDGDPAARDQPPPVPLGEPGAGTQGLTPSGSDQSAHPGPPSPSRQADPKPIPGATGDRSLAYFPLRVGAKWTYQQFLLPEKPPKDVTDVSPPPRTPDGTVTWAVEKNQFVKGREAARLNGSLGVWHVRVDPDGVYVLARGEVALEQPWQLLKLPHVDGATWTTEERLLGGVVETAAYIAKQAPVKVPAGEFKAVHVAGKLERRVNATVASTGRFDVWFAEGVGIVRLESFTSSSGMGLSGGVRLELERYLPP